MGALLSRGCSSSANAPGRASLSYSTMWLLMALVGVISAAIHLPIELEPLSIVRISETGDQVVGDKAEPMVVATAAGSAIAMTQDETSSTSKEASANVQP
jgi:hypothetical protein